MSASFRAPEATASATLLCSLTTSFRHQCVAVCCSVLQRVAACCSVLQHFFYPSPPLLGTSVAKGLIFNPSDMSHTEDSYIHIHTLDSCKRTHLEKTHLPHGEVGGFSTQKNVRGEIGEWGRVPFDEPYAPSLSTIYDGA